VTGKYSTPESVVMRFEAEAMLSAIVTRHAPLLEVPLRISQILLSTRNCASTYYHAYGATCSHTTSTRNNRSKSAARTHTAKYLGGSANYTCG
jgi:hypothetical protein